MKSKLDYVSAFCETNGLPAPVREHVFAPPRRWRFDYCWPDYRVALEQEGGTWRAGGGAHRGVGFLRDLEKYNNAALLGWIVLRFTPTQIKKGQFIEMLKRASDQEFVAYPKFGDDLFAIGARKIWATRGYEHLSSRMLFDKAGKPIDGAAAAE